MPRRKGQATTVPRRGTARARIWMSMRILRRFTVPDLCRTSRSKKDNTQGFVRRLAVHGYVAPAGRRVTGRIGVYQPWRLAIDCGPHYPTRCARCGRLLSEPCEKPTGEEHGR